jgi:hypothetical protein
MIDSVWLAVLASPRTWIQGSDLADPDISYPHISG